MAGTSLNYKIIDRYVIINETGGNISDRVADSQQQKTVSGTVTDEAGQPLPGVTVIIKSTTQGTVANENGKYSLNNVLDGATLVFSFVGMQTQEIEVGNQNTVDVTMFADAIGIEEVVAHQRFMFRSCVIA